MTNKILNREGECKGGEKTRKKIIFAIVAVALCATMIVFAVQPSIASWIDNSIVSVTSSTATTGITTQVVGVATNAYYNPIDINGQLYTSAGGVGPNVITSFNSGPISSNPTTLISTVSISASGFVPGDYALFQVTITNNGPTTLQFTDPYTILNYFVGPVSETSYNFPSYDGYGPGPIVPVNVPPAVTGPADNSGSGWQYDKISDGWTSEATTAAMTSDFLTAIGPTDPYGLINTWGANNYLIGAAPTVGQTLATSGTFVYYIAIGLGVDTAPGIPAAVYTITIPLTVAQ